MWISFISLYLKFWFLIGGNYFGSVVISGCGLLDFWKERMGLNGKGGERNKELR